jgi:hypothetical protein
MAFSAAQLSALETAAASGQLRVQLGDKVIQYQTLPDLLTAIRMARADVAAASTGASAIYRGTTRYLEYSRG